MKTPVARCSHCGALFLLQYYADGNNHCQTCNNVEDTADGKTPWEHIGWCDEGNLVVWHESQVFHSSSSDVPSAGQ